MGKLLLLYIWDLKKTGLPIAIMNEKHGMGYWTKDYKFFDTKMFEGYCCNLDTLSH